MPIRVPSYDNFDVLPEVRRGRAQSPLNNGGATAVAGEQLSNFGRNVQGAAGDAIDIIQKEQAKANKVRLNDAFNQASAAAHALRYDKDEGYLRLKGGDAAKGIEDKPLADWYGAQLDKKLAAIRDSIGNDAVAADFDLAAGDLKTKFHGDALAYEAEQSSVYAQQVRDATVMTSANDIAAEPAGKAVPFYVDRARSAAIDTARAKGLDGDALDGAVKDTMGKVHDAVVMSMLDNKNVKGAKAYFDAHVSDYSTLGAADTLAKLKAATDAATAVADVDDVLAEFGPRGYNEPWRASDIDAALRAKYKDDPAGLKAARAEVDERQRNWQFQENERNAQNVNAVWNQLNRSGVTSAEVESSPAWLSLPGTTRAQLKDAYVRRRDGGEYMTPANWARWYNLFTDSFTLSGYTPAQLQALEPEFGQQLTQQLVAQRSKVLEEKQKLGAAVGKIDNDTFNTYASRYGLKPFSSNDNDKAKVAQLRSRLETLLNQEQQKEKRPLSPTEIEEFLRKQMSRQVVLGEWYGGTTTKPLLTLSPEDAARFKATGADRKMVVDYMKREFERTGDPKFEPTEENLRRVYLSLVDAGQFFVDE